MRRRCLSSVSLRRNGRIVADLPDRRQQELPKAVCHPALSHLHSLSLASPCCYGHQQLGWPLSWPHALVLAHYHSNTSDDARQPLLPLPEPPHLPFWSRTATVSGGSLSTDPHPSTLSLCKTWRRSGTQSTTRPTQSAPSPSSGRVAHSVQG